MSAVQKLWLAAVGLSLAVQAPVLIIATLSGAPYWLAAFFAFCLGVSVTVPVVQLLARRWDA